MADAFAQSLAPKIEEILTGSNLESVSAKAVRKTLINQGIDESYIKNYKSQIDDVIKGIYLRLSTAALQATPVSEQNSAYHSVAMPAPGAMKREAPFSSQSSEPKRARSTSKAKSAATVGSEEENGTKKKAKPKRKKRVVDGEKSELPPNNPFNKPLQLSSALSILLGESQVSRPQAVKLLWQYIKEHGLQDPEDKRYIMCDEKLMNVLGEPRVHMMTMNKLLSRHFSPLPVPVDSPSTLVPVSEGSDILPPHDS